MITLVGLDYHSAPIAIREKLYIPEENLHDSYQKLLSKFQETVILSTCNRLEIYATNGKNDKEVEQKIIAFLKEHFSTNLNRTKYWQSFTVNESVSDVIKLTDYTYTAYGTKAVNHLFEVATGIRSLVIGENEILGQLKTSYQNAQKHQACQSFFNKLFQSAVAIGKQVRHQTNISRGGVSVASTSIDLIKEVYQKDSKFTLLLIGAGTVAEEVVKALTNHGEANLIIANRTQERAENILKNFSGRWVNFDDRYQEIKEADVIISSTTSQEYIIEPSELVASLKGKTHFQFFIDLSVPRNINPQINDLPDTALYTVDDLEFIVVKNLKNRHLNLEKVKRMINLAVEEFNDWQQRRRQYKKSKI